MLKLIRFEVSQNGKENPLALGWNTTVISRGNDRCFLI